MLEDTSRLFEIERQEAENLTKFIYDDFWLWTSMRIHLLKTINPELKAMVSNKRGNPRLNRLVNFLKMLLNLKEYLKLAFMRKSDVLIFTYKLYRRDYVEGYHRDVYFGHLIEYMESQRIKYSVISEDEDTFYRLRIRERKHVYFRHPFMFLSKMRFMFLNVNKVIPSELLNLAKDLENKYQIPFVSVLKLTIKEYITRRRVYSRFVRKAAPRYVFMVPSISKEALISTCKKLDITTIEGEHGTFVPILHNYSENLRKLVLDKGLKTQAPDYYLCFGKNTHDELVKSSLIKPENVRIIGNTRIDHFMKRFNEVERNNDGKINILVTSQFTLTDEFIVFFKGVNDYLVTNGIDNIHINVKLHYDEMHKLNQWKKAESRHLKIIDREEEKTHNLFEMIIKSDFVASVYSTTLAESINFGKPTIILKLWGWEIYKEFIDKGLLLPVATPEEFVKTVLEYNTNEAALTGLRQRMTDFNALVNTPNAITNYIEFFKEIYNKP